MCVGGGLLHIESSVADASRLSSLGDEVLMVENDREVGEEPDNDEDRDSKRKKMKNDGSVPGATGLFCTGEFFSHSRFLLGC